MGPTKSKEAPRRLVHQVKHHLTSKDIKNINQCAS